MLIVGVSVHGLAQASVEGLPALSLLPAPTKVEAASETAQWRTVVHEAPSVEVSALEPEANEEPCAPEAPSVIGVGCRRTASSTASEQKLRGTLAVYSLRFSASPGFARAPPRRSR
jgi:hypothetical protein